MQHTIPYTASAIVIGRDSYLQHPIWPDFIKWLSTRETESRCFWNRHESERVLYFRDWIAERASCNVIIAY